MKMYFYPRSLTLLWLAYAILFWINVYDVITLVSVTDAFSINIFPAPSSMHSSMCRCRQSSSLQLLSSTTAVVHNNDRQIRRLVIRCDMSTTDDKQQQDIQAESSTITTTTTEQQLQKRLLTRLNTFLFMIRQMTQTVANGVKEHKEPRGIMSH